MKLMWHYISRYKKVLLINLIGSFGFVLVELGLPTMLADLVNGVTAGRDRSFMVGVILKMIGVSLLGFIGRAVVSYATSYITTRMVADMRDDMYHHIQTFSHHEFNTLGVSSLVTRVTNDAFVTMQFAQMVLRTGLATFLMLFASFYMIFQTSPELSWILIPAFPMLFLGVLLIGKRTQPLSAAQQQNLDNINQNLRESLSGLRVIRAFVREAFESERFLAVNESYSRVSRRLFQLLAWTQPIFSFVINVIILGIMWFGAQKLETGDLLLGNLVAYIEYSFHALFSFLNFAIVFMMYPRAAVSAQRIREVLDTASTISTNEEGVTDTESHGVVRFEKVTFAYPGENTLPVVHDISFEARPGETVAFIGSTGSGKSTLIQLIPRFFDVTEGKVLIDGVDVRAYHLDALRRKIGFVPQKAVLFTGTIAENLRYGHPEATDVEVRHAADIAQAREFIEKRPLQYDEFLAEGGSNLSGGQKQRLAIARAVIRRPDIYIFDDSFSALDYKTDATLRARLQEETKDKTVLIVAQRVSTIRDADRIVVLDEGEIVGTGTHEELLKQCPVYYDIASSQLSEEELA